MATFANLSQYLSLATDDMSDHIEDCSLSEEYAELDFTNFASAGKTEWKCGLLTTELSITFQGDYAASQIWALWNTSKGTAIAFEWRPTSASVSPTNPKATGSVLLSKMPQGGKVGDKVIHQVTWKITGGATWATS